MGAEDFQMTDYNAIFTAACNLTDDDKLRLIDELSSLVADDRPPTLSAEWQNEVVRRSAELKSGDVVGIAWKAVQDGMRRRVGLFS